MATLLSGSEAYAYAVLARHAAKRNPTVVVGFPLLFSLELLGKVQEVRRIDLSPREHQVQVA